MRQPARSCFRVYFRVIGDSRPAPHYRMFLVTKNSRSLFVYFVFLVLRLQNVRLTLSLFRACLACIPCVSPPEFEFRTRNSNGMSRTNHSGDYFFGDNIRCTVNSPFGDKESIFRRTLQGQISFASLPLVTLVVDEASQIGPGLFCSGPKFGIVVLVYTLVAATNSRLQPFQSGKVPAFHKHR